MPVSYMIYGSGGLLILVLLIYLFSKKKKIVPRISFIPVRKMMQPPFSYILNKRKKANYLIL